MLEGKIVLVFTLGFGVHIYRRLGLGLRKHQPMAAQVETLATTDVETRSKLKEHR
jgi:hypothetical protein